MAWLCDYVHAFRVKLMEFLQCEKEVQLDDSEKAARMVRSYRTQPLTASLGR